MFTVTVTATFSATHRVKMPDGSLEPLHGHDWVIRAGFSREALDDRGMVVDFCQAESALRTVVAPWQHGNLNDFPEFVEVAPTAEIVAQRVFRALGAMGFPELCRVEVVEAPGCVAVFQA